MIYLLLAIVCSLAIGMIFKYGEVHHLHRRGLLAVNYVVAAVAAGVVLGTSSTPIVWNAGLIVLGSVVGALFIGVFFLFVHAIGRAGMALALGVMRVSVVMAFLASWWVWGEVPTLFQGIGLGLASIAFFFMAQPAQSAETQQVRGMSIGVFGLLVWLFLGGGTVDISMKIFDESYAAVHDRSFFLVLVFGVAALIGVGLVMQQGWRGEGWPDRQTVGWGIVLGLVNYGSAEFFLLALKHLPGPYVFPANSIALVIGAALLGVYVWGERLSRRNLWGLALAALALFLLHQ